MITQPYIIHYNTTLHYTLSQSNTPSPQAPISVQVRTHLVKIKCLLNGTQFGTFLEAFLAPHPRAWPGACLGTMLGQSLTVARNSNFVKYFVMTVSSAPQIWRLSKLGAFILSTHPSPSPSPRPCRYDVLTLLLLETENWSHTCSSDSALMGTVTCHLWNLG